MISVITEDLPNEYELIGAVLHAGWDCIVEGKDSHNTKNFLKDCSEVATKRNYSDVKSLINSFFIEINRMEDKRLLS